MSLIDIRFRGFWRDVLAPIIAVICAATILSIIGYRTFIINECKFCPVTMNKLTLLNTQGDDAFKVGDLVQLKDGLCNSYKGSLSIEVYLGAESSVGGSFNTRSIDLLYRDNGNGILTPAIDTPEGRIRRTLEPGCTITEPLTAPLPTTFTPGVWHLKAHVIATGPNGQIQDIVRVSNTFEVLR